MGARRPSLRLQSPARFYIFHSVSPPHLTIFAYFSIEHLSRRRSSQAVRTCPSCAPRMCRRVPLWRPIDGWTESASGVAGAMSGITFGSVQSTRLAGFETWESAIRTDPFLHLCQETNIKFSEWNASRSESASHGILRIGAVLRVRERRERSRRHVLRSGIDS